uniref:Uncharacterized protein n=1 Tax=Faecalibaculum rodentium TaxID=1702221 RepID=A0A140DXD9_9FIRM|nr:hypothetical protein AALO17_21820 [Faecalibaculum rodentium]
MQQAGHGVESVSGCVLWLNEKMPPAIHDGVNDAGGVF